ncbi:MAG: hypothetical protein Q8K58_03835 [Acidimicrobiales bacterium]|nr:hypothetical protein [Acidimicrobiales bacterium]
MRLDDQIEALATRQHSLVATWQLHGLGASRTEIHRLREGRRWSQLSPPGLGAPWQCGDTRPPTHGRRARRQSGRRGLARFGGRAVVAPGPKQARVHVTRHRGVARRSSPICAVHEVIDLLPQHVGLLRGIPLTSPARTVFDLAATYHPARLERLLDWCWSAHLFDGSTLDRTVRELAERGRTGSTAMRELAAARGPSYVPPTTGL